MRERLAEFIKTENLTPSKLAEILNVQPSSISHLLAGRNKPGFDFIVKFLQRFPKVNPDWLLLGKGKIYRTEDYSPSLTQSNIEPIMPDLFSEDQRVPDNIFSANEKILLDKEPTNPLSNNNSLQSREQKIEQLIICFEDRTFVSYTPRK